MGDEGHEGLQDRQGQEGQVLRLEGQQGEDRRRFEEDRLDQVQERKDRLQEGVRQRQEGLQAHLRLDRRCLKGPQGSRHQGFLPGRWQDLQGSGLPQEGQVLLQEVDRRSFWRRNWVIDLPTEGRTYLRLSSSCTFPPKVSSRRSVSLSQHFGSGVNSRRPFFPPRKVSNDFDVQWCALRRKGVGHSRMSKGTLQ